MDKDRNLIDKINEELEELGLHLRLSSLLYTKDESLHDYVTPMHEWVHEMLEVENIVMSRIKNAQLREQGL